MKLDGQQRKKIADLYRAGVSVRGLRLRFGRLNYKNLKDILAEHGVPVRDVQVREHGDEP
jgi:hypothetical protein